jgi:hypothetical protein
MNKNSIYYTYQQDFLTEYNKKYGK